MATERTRSIRKSTGGRYKTLYRKSRQYARVQAPALTKLGESKTRVTRATAGMQKVKLLSVNKISVADPKTKKVKQATIKTVKQNDANINFIIRNIMNKGAVVETDLGLVKITSRPGQNASLSGVLLHK
ncbi:MAG TPA: 30S ribosomal protein S8e [Acidobacteriota bacterium]|nr:30S ribosomal protein S8e [Acidobacteriota bacterium]